MTQTLISSNIFLAFAFTQLAQARRQLLEHTLDDSKAESGSKNAAPPPVPVANCKPNRRQSVADALNIDTDALSPMQKRKLEEYFGIQDSELQVCALLTMSLIGSFLTLQTSSGFGFVWLISSSKSTAS